MHLAAPRARGLAAALDELAEAVEVALHAPLGQAQRAADGLDEAVGLVLHAHVHLGAVRAERLEAHLAGVALAGDRGPRDALVRHLVDDLGVPLGAAAADVRDPVQARVVELPHLLDALHELRELLELRPLVVGRAHGHVELTRLLDRRQAALLHPAGQVHGAADGGPDQDHGLHRRAATPLRAVVARQLRDRPQQPPGVLAAHVACDVRLRDDADELVPVDHRQAAHAMAGHGRDGVLQRVVCTDGHRLSFREFVHSGVREVASEGDRLRDQVAVGQHPLEAAVLAADRHGAEVVPGKLRAPPPRAWRPRPGTRVPWS